MIGGGIVAIGAVIYFISKGGNSGGTSTTSATTSINAALGSLQEENQNLLGTVQAGQQANATGFGGLSTQIQSTQDAITAAIQDQGTTLTQTIQTQADVINQNANNNNTGVLSAISDALGKLLAGQQTVTSTVQGGIEQGNQNVISSLQSQEAATLATIIPQLNQLNQLVASGNSTNNAQIANLQDSITQSLNTEQASFQQSLNGLGGGLTNLGGQVQNLTDVLGKVQSGSVGSMSDLAPLSGQILFSRNDNTRYLVGGNGGLTELTYQQETALRNAGAGILYVTPSLSQFKIGGTGDRG